MKFRILLLASLVLTGLFFSSCKKDETTQKFSKLTVEQNKANIENDGLDMLNSIKELESGVSVQAAVNMVNYMNLGFLFENNPSMNTVKKDNVFNEFLKPVMIAANLKKFNAKKVAEQLKLKLVPSTIVDMWNNYKGTYTWNYADSTWNYTAGDEIRITFPSVEAGTTNNVVFRVYDFTYQDGPFSWAGDYTGELPKGIKCELKVDQNILLAYSLEASYTNEDKKPNYILTTLDLTPFVFSLEAKNKNNESGSFVFNLKKESKTLVMLSLSVNGDWTSENLANEDLWIGDIFYGGNATFQLMNTKVVGDVDLAKINEEMTALDESGELSDTLYIAKQCEIINANAKLWVCYVDNNQIIAKVIAFPSSYYEEEYNYDTQEYEMVTYYEVSLRFLFYDNSTVDIGTYFDEGFDNLFNEFYDYMDELNGKY